jgi:DNA topoisomerase-2
MLPGSDKKTKIQLGEVREYHTEENVHFSVRCTQADLKTAKAQEGSVESFFRLKTAVNETNMVLFDKDGKITKYKDVIAIMSEFAKVRLKYYDIRKKYMVDKLSLERDLLSNRARFIGMIIAKKLHINNRKKAEVVKDLTRLKFKKFGDSKAPRTGYEYLLIMHIVSLTLERKQELEKLLDEKSKELVILKKTTIQKMWENDLDRLEAGIKAVYPEKGPESSGLKKKGKLKLWKGAKKQKKGKGKRGKTEDEEDEGEGGGDGEAAEEGAAPADEGVFGSHFSDVTRWTSGHIKLPSTGNIRKKAKF